MTVNKEARKIREYGRNNRTSGFNNETERLIH